jgi:cytochrome c peroxidase
MITLLALLACSSPEKVTEPVNPQITDAVTQVSPQELAGFSPLPKNFFENETLPDQQLLSLGEKLFNEKKLSADSDISCASCHTLATGGVDGKQFSDGHRGAKTGRNSPTVLNAAGHVAQFWDGRAPDVETQALGPILAAGEMGMPNEQAVVSVLSADPEYVAAFKSAFPEQSNPLTFQNVGVAIGAYERTLVTPSRWDEFLSGDQSALTELEKQGFKEFLSAGCSACHSGQLLGGSTFMKLGLVNPWPNQLDLGKFSLTNNEGDKMVFKVPSLRNSALTGPYFHDGSVKTLPEAVKMMAYHQLGKEISDEQVESITAWLVSTSGK